MHPKNTGSERLRLSPFDALPEDGPPRRDQRDLMERPFFSLAKGRRTAPILYRAGGIEVQVHAVPEHGMATIWDADVLIWAGSQIVAAAERGVTASRFLRFTPYHLLTAIGRGAGQHQYLLLKAALARLQSTAVRTTIRNGAQWRRQQFSWINEWEERVTASGRCEGMEFILPDWFRRSSARGGLAHACRRCGRGGRAGRRRGSSLPPIRPRVEAAGAEAGDLA